MMAQTLTWQGAYVVAELGIESPRTKSDADGRLAHEPTAAAIASLTHDLLAASALTGVELVERATALVRSLNIDDAHVAPAA